MNIEKTERINVLVTGGAGSVGSQLCEFLLTQEKYNVICVDNYFSGREANIDRLLAHPRFEFIRHDITEPLDFSKLPAGEKFKIAFVGVQEIYHLAGPDSPRVYLASPVEVLTQASQGTKNMLDLALQYRAKFLLASDTSVYGDITGDAPVGEEYHGPLDYLSAINVTAQAKRIAETLTATYQRLYSLEAKIVRLHNVFGLNMHFGDGRFIPDTIEKALKNEPIILSPALVRASFLFASDAVDALEKIMSADKDMIVNLSQSSMYSFDEIVKTILDYTGSSSTVTRAEPSIENAQLMKVWEWYCHPIDTTRIRNDIGWFPVVLLADGLHRTIDFMKSTRGLADLRSAQQ